MNNTLIIEEYFDGEKLHSNGPYEFTVEDDVISSIEVSPEASAQIRFAMPGLVDAHVHLFLDGGELDFKRRSEYLKADFDTMLRTGVENIEKHLAAGITLIRDAGDVHGVNHQLRQLQSHSLPRVRSPGNGMRRLKRYGSFFAKEVDTLEDIRSTTEAHVKKADDIKVVLTGIIDFENACVKGDPQFSLDELNAIQKIAEDNGRKTFVHCSGTAGLDVAVEAGVNSIEHGFFMEKHHIDIMAQKSIAWVPTFAPVCFQRDRPDLAGWSAQVVENISEIIKSHEKMIRYAAEQGVDIFAGSDAGSYGVVHGQSLIDEILFLSKAGMDTETLLNAASIKPRDIWHEDDTRIKEGNKADIITMQSSPFEDINALRNVTVLK